MANKEKKYVIDNEKLMSEWHWEKNNELGLHPEEFACGSSKKAWWICNKSHEWEAKIDNRYYHASNCPYCSNKKILIGYNDLATTNPKLAKEWHPTKNGKLTPKDIMKGSLKKVWWTCDKRHEWEASINDRNRGNGCPYCANKKVLVGYNDLQTSNPKLAKEWHPTKNGKLTPKDIVCTSTKKVWWLSECGHEWKAVIRNRTRGSNCPYCSGNKLLIGYNDLATTNPELIKEWNIEKNDDLTPKDIMKGSDKKVWWICEKGHEWKATVNSRSDGSDCPHCAKERQTSFAEQAILFYCKKITNVENRCKKFEKEIDIYLPEYCIGIEYNGSYWHKNRESKDKEKVKYFADKGIRIVTVKESDRNFIDNDIIEHIYSSSNKMHLNFAIKSVLNLIGLQYEDVDVERDMNKIFEQYIDIEKENSIITKNKNAVIEWNYEKNGSLKPETISYGSDKKVWWTCRKCGHEWQSKAYSYSHGKGCPKCAKQKISKRVRCIETGDVYCSCKEAYRQTGIKNVGEVCNGKRKTAGGYHWEFVNES